MESGQTRFAGCPHHVIQRGHARCSVFLDDDDRLGFVQQLRAATRAEGVHIWAYVLMRNHIHLVAVPDEAESLTRSMDRCLGVYAHSFRRRHDLIGEVWHQRFYASRIASKYLWETVRYVERNPVRAGIVPRAEAYPWSSAGFHCGHRREDPLVSPASPLKGAVTDWAAWLQEPDQDGHLAFLRRRATRSQASRPTRFIGVFEDALDRRISGRKPKRTRGRYRKVGKKRSS